MYTCASKSIENKMLKNVHQEFPHLLAYPVQVDNCETIRERFVRPHQFGHVSHETSSEWEAEGTLHAQPTS